MESKEVLAKLYGIRRRRGRRGLWRRLGGTLSGWVRRNDRYVALWTVALTATGIFGVYYYNQLTILEFDVLKTDANLRASELRRGHIQRNLARLLQHYADYERQVMGELTRLRTGEPTDGEPRASDESTQDLLTRLQLIAEQYPSLRLTDSTQQLGTAVVLTETDINQRIVEYNEAVNRYTTELTQFPGNVLGPALGFESYEFYTPERGSPTAYEELEL